MNAVSLHALTTFRWHRKHGDSKHVCRWECNQSL